MDHEEEENQEADLLRAFNERFGSMAEGFEDISPSAQVLADAQFIYDNAIDVSISRTGIESAARTISDLMQRKQYSPATWATHELHPDPKGGARTVDFIFTMDLLNFSFWSENSAEERFAISYRDRKWTGYWSLVAALQRALEEGIPITRPAFWHGECTDEVIRHIFRSATAEEIPLLQERIACLREAGAVLVEKYNGSFANCIASAGGSAASLMRILTSEFACFRDECMFEGRTVRFFKRPQILIADIWACFEGNTFGEFHDIDELTMFADYRIPQMLNNLGCLLYSPPLESHLRRHNIIEFGNPWEVELRGCSIWAVELIVRLIKAADPPRHVNAILVDFFLYDTAKEREAAGKEIEMMPHHRTRSIWY